MTHMTDLEKFKKFFDSMGVPYGEIFREEAWLSRDVRKNFKPQNLSNQEFDAFLKQYGVEHILLPVSQAIFHFSTEGVYLGVESDEMGHYEERK